ncbi:MAG: choice-of-anchor P family protein [Acidimicrobiales bacterium]
MRRSRRPFGALALAALLLALAGWRVPIAAQEAPTGRELAAQFGGFQLSARASGVQVTYDSPGLLPISPIIQVSVPESTSTGSPGPNMNAVGGLAHPGPILGNLPALVAQFGSDAPIPEYPLRVHSNSASGPPSDEQSVATGSARATTSDSTAESTTFYSGVDLPGFVRIGGITSSSYAALEQGQVVSRSRVELAGVDLLFGLVHIDSIVTDLVANSDAEAAASDGTTTVTGVTVLGTAATLGADGLTIEPAPEQPPSPLDPVLGSLPDLGPITDGLAGVTPALNQLLTTVLGTATGTVNDLFGAGGIGLRLLDPVAENDGPAADRTAGGVVLELAYDGQTTPVFSQLLAAIPPESLPSQGIPGVPIPSSPQALVGLLRENHITTIAIGAASVHAAASPSFLATPRPPTVRGTSTPPIGSPGGVSVPGAPAFSTPTPELATGGGGGVPASSTSGPLLGAGLSALLVLLVALTSPLFGAASSRLADDALGGAAIACPEGRDRPGGKT